MGRSSRLQRLRPYFRLRPSSAMAFSSSTSVARFARPRIKEVFGVLHLEGRVRIGGGYAYVSEIEDPDGTYSALLRLLDGSRDETAIAAEMAGRLDAGAISESIAMLAQAGYLEDAAAEPPAALSASELARYKGNLNFFSTLVGRRSKYECQLRLKSATGVMFGLGGIGSNVCMALAELGVGQLVGVDFDGVELGNLNRQVLYSTTAVGRPKAAVAAERLQAFNPEVRFEALARRMDSLDDVREILDAYSCDFVVNLADKPNGYIDHWVNEACVERGLPLFAASIFCGVGTAYTVIPGASACYACRVAHEIADAPELAEELEHVRSHRVNNANGALGLACMFQAYMVSSEILRHLLDIGPLLTHDTLEIDFVTFDQTFHHFEHDPHCQICTEPTGAHG
jgi:molybdopterin-synthase adenylyltransferase